MWSFKAPVSSHHQLYSYTRHHHTHSTEALCTLHQTMVMLQGAVCRCFFLFLFGLLPWYCSLWSAVRLFLLHVKIFSLCFFTLLLSGVFFCMRLFSVVVCTGWLWALACLLWLPACRVLKRKFQLKVMFLRCLCFSTSRLSIVLGCSQIQYLQFVPARKNREK